MLIHEFFGEGDYRHRRCMVYESLNDGYIVIFLGEGKDKHMPANTERQAETLAEDWVMGVR